MERYLSYKKGRIRYTDSGKGSVIVLLHGYLETLDVWTGFAENFLSGFRIISIDLPGHGNSDVFGETHSMEFLATSVKEILDALSIDKAFIIGHSLGGYVALAFLDLYHDRLYGYSLFHSHPLADSPEALEKRDTEIAMVKSGKKDLILPGNLSRMFANSNIDVFSDDLDVLMNRASQIPGDGIVAMLNGMKARPSRLNVMEEGKVPCLWLLGKKDNYIPYDIMTGKVNLPDNARVVILNNSGHMGFIEEADTSADILTKFVKELNYQ